MSKDNVIDLKKPDVFINDPITELVRNGARQILANALESEITIFINQYKDLVDELGRQRVVRNGYLPEREIQTGIGPVAVKAPRVRDRSAHCTTKIVFNSNILPPYLRRTKSMEHLIPWLYLKGVSTGDFTDALAALVGKDAPGLSAATISRLKTIWETDVNRHAIMTYL